MALDLVETGDDTDLYGQNEKVNKILPARVTTQMLCKILCV